MKLVSDSAYSAMKQAADNWQKLTQQVTQGTDAQPEQITVESLTESLEQPGQLAEQASEVGEHTQHVVVAFGVTLQLVDINHSVLCCHIT